MPNTEDFNSPINNGVTPSSGVSTGAGTVTNTTSNAGQTLGTGNPNDIEVEITDKESPIIVMFGPPNSGKTMMLVRLVRYLRENGYTVNPVRTFRRSTDVNYKEVCDSFDGMVGSPLAQASTNLINFLLVEVRKDGNKVCQLLEAPGEGYFDPKNPKEGFRRYVHAVINSENRKLWAVMVEPDWNESEIRAQYVQRVSKLHSTTGKDDAFLFVYNKIDKTPFVVNKGVNEKAAIKDVKEKYPGIFEPFKDNRPIISWFSGYDCDFVPFSTGTYSSGTNGLTYQPSSPDYPQRLWNKIVKRLKRNRF